jgi:hypothetical protein
MQLFDESASCAAQASAAADSAAGWQRQRLYGSAPGGVERDADARSEPHSSDDEAHTERLRKGQVGGSTSASASVGSESRVQTKSSSASERGEAGKEDEGGDSDSEPDAPALGNVLAKISRALPRMMAGAVIAVDPAQPDDSFTSRTLCFVELVTKFLRLIERAASCIAALVRGNASVAQVLQHVGVVERVLADAHDALLVLETDEPAPPRPSSVADTVVAVAVADAGARLAIVQLNANMIHAMLQPKQREQGLAFSSVELLKLSNFCRVSADNAGLVRSFLDTCLVTASHS